MIAIQKHNSKNIQGFTPLEIARPKGPSGAQARARFQTGFTLIELLVVIAIIGLLSSVILVSLNSVRAKARDAKRIADMKQIQTALELYYDANSAYPRYDGGGTVACTDAWATVVSSVYQPCWDDLAAKLAPYFRLPLDPTSGNPNPYHYRTLKSGRGYYLLMWPEGSHNDDGCYDGAGNWYCVGLNWL